ncbi:DNA polymerase III subunit delta' [Helicobacter sp. 11S03491-1]|uniref:DNA polymerase III subunit delta' n=1 Tax=Helicobacter sp. 11S03491-1 TaxID=1476196 RepID=UPI000BA6B918|nr:DNA polymerase III subunit delta' [Helicobacter sp. 11S03491-1]PAF42222.1 hypothetical protein BKH45_04565 [Helicobacter sp. 11S03491-1]
MQSYTGKIVLNNDIYKEIEKQSVLIQDEFLRVFDRDEFKIEDSHEVIAEAYLTSGEVKTIIIAANSFNHFAQNALLKVLEEPPNNTRFLLIAKNKTAFLPTIRSRLPLEDKREKKKNDSLRLDVKNLSLKIIYDFLKELESQNNNSRDMTKQKIQALLFMLEQNGVQLDEYELKNFDEALMANQNYQRDIYVFLPLLLMVLRKIKISRKG